MAGNFVLRDENDPNNPTAARVYGKGVTTGRPILYQNNGEGSQTIFLALLAEGARFRDDLGCDSIVRVYYAGFELPEFTGEVRNWKFHKGTVAKAPVYKPIQSVDTSANTWRSDGHGYVTGDPIALHKRGDTVTIPVAVPVIQPHTKYLVWVVDANNFKILNQSSGTPDELNAFDITTAGANLDKLFVYKADALYFDAEMGRPEFFPTLNFTFSGFSYIEVRLPVHLSDGESEPTQLKVIMNGKQVYGITNSGGNVAFDTGVITAEPNPALVAADLAVNDAKLALSKLNGTTFVNWRNRADALINWIGGNDNPAVRSSFPLFGNVTYNAALAKLTNTGGGEGYVLTEEFTARYPSAEFRYNGGIAGAFFNGTTDPSSSTRQGVECWGGYVRARLGATLEEIVPVAVGDRIKIAYENGLMKIYKNSIPLPLVNVGQQQTLTTYRIQFLVGEAGDNIDQMLVAPSGTNSLPRQVKRFYGGIVAVQPTPVADMFETLIHLSAGCSWAYIDGQIQVATEPDRTPCFTFIHDPSDPNVKSNVRKVTPKRKSDPYNFYRYLYRDLDDFVLSRKYVTVDRKERRASIGGRLIDAGLQSYSVLTQSQMERIAEMNARLLTDLDVGFTVEAFLDSIAVTRGSFVELVAPEAGYTAVAPALCIVNDINYNFGADVETIIYELQVITADFYSDTAHGAVTPVQNAGNNAAFTPPLPVTSIALSETVEPLPDNSYVSSISGTVQFSTGFNQHGRVFTKTLTNRLGDVTLDSGTDVFTLVNGRVPAANEQVSLGSKSDAMPTDASYDTGYYPVNIVGSTFKLSRTEGGAAENFGSNGADLAIYSYAGWIDTNVDVFPDATLTGTFELIPARKSLTVVRVEARSAANVAVAFTQQTLSALDVIGDPIDAAAPENVDFAYNGVALELNWSPSPSHGVRAYLITDEANRTIAQVGSEHLSYVQAAQADRVTRRIFAVNSSGVLSGEYAEATWIRPPHTSWVNVEGLTINFDNTLTKTAATGWGNAGAALSHAVVSDRIAARLSGAPDRTNTYQVFGFSHIPNPNGLEDFIYALYFLNDGTIHAYYNGGATQTFLGTYEVGKRYAIDITPEEGNPSVPSHITIKRLDYSPTGTVEVLLHTFPEPSIRNMPLYIGVALYTNGSTSNLAMEISGDLIPTIGTPPPSAVNLVNTSYVPATGVLKNTGGSSGYGTSGASFPQVLEPTLDGGWIFTIGAGKAAVGASVVGGDTDQTNTSISARIEREPDLSANIYFGMTLVASMPAGSVTATTPILLGQENGVLVFRVDGVLKWTNSNLIFSETQKILDTAFDGDYLNTEVTIRRHDAYSSYLDENENVIPLSANARGSDIVGKNTADAIPKFNISNPQAGETLTFNSSLEVVNSTAGGITVGQPVAGGGANRVLFEDASNNIGSHSGFKFESIGLRLVDKSAWIDGESQGLIVDAAGLKRYGMMKYNGYETGIYRSNSVGNFIIGRTNGADITSSLPANSDLIISNTGNVLLGATSHTQTPNARLEVNGSGELLRLGFDTTRYLSAAVDGASVASVDVIGTGAQFWFKKPAQFNSGVGSTWFAYTDGKNYISASETIFRNASNSAFLSLTDTLLTLVNGVNIGVGTGSGTKIGTSASQKLGFWGNLPVARITYGTVQGFNTRRDFDPTVNTLAELMDFVCTLYDDLATYGLFTKT